MSTIIGKFYSSIDKMLMASSILVAYDPTFYINIGSTNFCSKSNILYDLHVYHNTISMTQTSTNPIMQHN